MFHTLKRGVVKPMTYMGEITQSLIDWYRTVARDLPWRVTQDPYAIWVSEIMLQQTQVTTVLPYYDRFLKRFPTIQALAQAPSDDVMKHWEGLGYYARARNLHKAAKTILDVYNGVFPNTLDSVASLCGIGRSTAGAILTFAFHQPHPILDGNVKRVLSRLTAESADIASKEALDRLWQVSTALLPANTQDAYDLNQGLMELGATLCTPKKPGCGQCPWQTTCVAYQQGTPESYPVKTPKKATPHYTIGVGVVWKDDKILIALRPEEGLLGGLWEFPGGKCDPNETIGTCIERELLEETGLVVKSGPQIAVVKHAYTHFKITLHAHHCDYVSGNALPKASQALKWVRLAELEQYAFPTANRKVLDALVSHPRQAMLF